MAQIQINATFIWNNGIESVAKYLDAQCIQDNLENAAKFYYTLLDINYNTLISGNVTINGDQYIQWLANDFSTNWIMNFIAEQLNLTQIQIN
jgi:hypothetical protein